tara:strand:+ start:159 stop:368 length:210 start_codon:yes stop_codon:yes gene_type:complete
MPMKIWKSLHPRIEIDIVEDNEEDEVYIFDPEAGRASDDPFAHLADDDAPSNEAVSMDKVSKYVGGEEE